MAVDLEDLVESLQREVNPPGSDLYPDALAAEWLGRLQDAFWEAVLDGVITGFVESEGIVTPSTGTTDIGRDLQQLVVLYAGFNVALSAYRNIQTVFRAKAGPVEFETQQAASVLKGILDLLAAKRNLHLQQLAALGETDSYYIDAIQSRTDAMLNGLTFYTN